MRRRLLSTAASLLLTVVLAGACSNQGEAERCDPLADNNGNSDCDDGLVCTNVPNFGDICCPADRTMATTTQCALNNSGVNGDGAPPPGDDGSTDSSADGSGDAATDGAGDAPNDAPRDSASDAGGG